MMKSSMDEVHLVRPYLDSLTTQELVRIADSFGIDIPPNLERIFIIEELLDYARTEENDRDEEEPAIEESVTYLETAPIPRQYNITFIDVMIRDPLWAFVFWEIKEHDRELYEKADLFSGYYLRVNQVAQDGTIRKDRSFTVQVDNDDTARYLGFSEDYLRLSDELRSSNEQDPFPPAQSGGSFQVELCVGFGERGEVLASSRIFCLPKLPDQVGLSREIAEAAIPALAVLSGLNDFRILRNVDRPPHVRFSPGESG
jgi:hypothetical protein